MCVLQSSFQSDSRASRNRLSTNEEYDEYEFDLIHDQHLDEMSLMPNSPFGSDDSVPVDPTIGVHRPVEQRAAK